MKLTNILFLAAVLTGFAACNTSSPKPVPAGLSFSEYLKQYQEERLKFFPLEATYAGDNRFNDQLPNTLSGAYRKDLGQFYDKYAQMLGNYDRSKLNEEEQNSYDILNWEYSVNRELLHYPTQLMPLNQFDCLPLTMGQLAGGTAAQPFATVKDYDNWLKRLDAFMVWCDTALVNMQAGLEKGYVLPKALTVKLLPQFAALAKGPVENHLYYSPVKSMPDSFPAAEKSRLKDAYTTFIGERLIPEFAKIASFIGEKYLPASRSSSGISDTPFGKPYYALMAKLYTTTTMSPDEIFALGEKEVARLTAEMEKVKTQVGFKGDLKSFFESVRNRKELMPFTQPEQVLANFQAIYDKMKPNLVKLFDNTPKTPFQIKRTEAFREASASAEYVQGSLDGTRPGTFYVPIPDVKKYNMFADEDLFLHEAIPGHHYQISIQQENTSLPDFRRTLWYSAYGEGWALYTESLGKELGLYEDPYQYFGMLSEEMHRAIRLVVDAGMHYKGWTREQAIQYSLDREAESEAAITSEIERYMAIPGQALSYKIGQLKIRELRARAEQKMGPKFDIRIFHDKVLESGCLPLKVLEEKIDRWMESMGH